MPMPPTATIGMLTTRLIRLADHATAIRPTDHDGSDSTDTEKRRARPLLACSPECAPLTRSPPDADRLAAAPPQSTI